VPAAAVRDGGDPLAGPGAARGPSLGTYREADGHGHHGVADTRRAALDRRLRDRSTGSARRGVRPARGRPAHRRRTHGPRDRPEVERTGAKPGGTRPREQAVLRGRRRDQRRATRDAGGRRRARRSVGGQRPPGSAVRGRRRPAAAGPCRRPRAGGGRGSSPPPTQAAARARRRRGRRRAVAPGVRLRPPRPPSRRRVARCCACPCGRCGLPRTRSWSGWRSC
jgi:hypothetical protein